MSPTRVLVATIAVDPPHSKTQNIRYRIELQCGCFWWEDRAPHAGAPELQSANCYAPHSARETRKAISIPGAGGRSRWA
jgi:hypothetical protein